MSGIHSIKLYYIMSLRRSTRTSKPKVAWEANSAHSTALNIRITMRTSERAQKNASKSVALDPLLEIIESDKNAPFNGERDIRLPIVMWKVKGAPSAALDPKITQKAA